jgi:hypothetical protein
MSASMSVTCNGMGMYRSSCPRCLRWRRIRSVAGEGEREVGMLLRHLPPGGGRALS